MISKSEVLEQTGISYGQFYRWKRKGLIPETWFHRRSTFTGQEAFLPREKVLERIRRINALKDDYSLDEIAGMLSPDIVHKSYSLSEINRMGWISKQALELYQGVRGREGDYTFDEVVFITSVEQLLGYGKLSTEVVELAARSLLANFEVIGNDTGRYLTIVRRSSTSYSVLYSGDCFLDPDAVVIVTVDLDSVLENVKVRLENRFSARRQNRCGTQANRGRTQASRAAESWPEAYTAR